MQCDICKETYTYSEDIMYHITAEIDGVIKPHTHICKYCFEKLNLKPIKIPRIR